MDAFQVVLTQKLNRLIGVPSGNLEYPPDSSSQPCTQPSNEGGGTKRAIPTPDEGMIEEIENLVRHKLTSPSTPSLSSVHNLIRSSFSTTTSNLHVLHEYAMNPDKQQEQQRKIEEQQKKKEEEVGKGKIKKEKMFPSTDPTKDWNDRGSTKLMKRGCLFLLYTLAKVVHVIRETTTRVGKGKGIKGEGGAGATKWESGGEEGKGGAGARMRVDREGTSLMDITRRYESTFVEVVPLVTHLAGRKGEGLLRLGDKHSRPVRRVLLSLLKAKVCRPELTTVWFRQLCMQEGWNYEEAISDWWEVGGTKTAPNRAVAAEEKGGDGNNENAVSVEEVAMSAAPANAEIQMTVKDEKGQGDKVEQEQQEESVKQEGNAQEEQQKSNPLMGKNVPLNSYIRHDVFNLPTRGGITSHSELWNFRFALCNLLREFQGYKGITQNSIWLNSTYLAQRMAVYGRYKKEHLRAIATACFVLAAKASDISFRLTSLVVDKVMIEGVQRAKGIPKYGRVEVDEKELEIEFPKLTEEEGRRQLDPSHKGYDLVWDKDRRRMIKQTNYNKEKQPFEVPKKSELRKPFVLPSLVSAYEFQLLNTVGYDLDLSQFFPGFYFKKVEERARELGLTKEVLDRTKTNLKHISVAFSGLNIKHQPNYILAAGIYLALKHHAGKLNSPPNSNPHVIAMEGIAKKLDMDLITIQAFSRHLTAVKDHMRLWHASDASEADHGWMKQEDGKPTPSLQNIIKANKGVEEALSPDLTGLTVRIGSGEKKKREATWAGSSSGKIHEQISKIPEKTKNSLPKEALEKLAEHREKKERSEKHKKRRLSESGRHGK